VPDKYDIADPNDPNTLRVPFMFVPHGCEPGEAPEPGQSYDVMRDAIAARRAAEEVFADPGRFVGIVRTAADQQSEPGANVAPSAQAHDSPHLQLVHYFVRSGRESPGRCLLLVTGHDTTARKPVELRRRVRTGGDCRTHHSTAL
jgi:hypothetical protein